MANDFQTLFKDIEAGKIASIYFFYGDEPYPIDHLIKHLLDRILDPSVKDFNFDSFAGPSADITGLVAIARSFPMMGERRVVILKDVQQLSQSDRNRLLTYVQSPMESTCLVLVSNRADRRQKFWSTLSDNSVWIESKSLYDNQAVDWIIRHMQKRQIKITQDAAKLLVQYVGTSLWNLFHELEKIATFCWGKTELTRLDILGVAGMSREYNIWELTDAVARREPVEALKILSFLIDAKQSPVGMIMDLTRRLLILIRLKLCMEQRISQDQIVKSLGLRPYFVKLFSEQARQFTLEEAQNGLETLYSADRAIKTGLLDPVMAMTLVVYDLTQKQHRYFNKVK